MKQLLFCLLIAGSMTACQQPGISPTNCREGKCTYTFQENSRIRILPPVNRVVIDEGENLVFLYEYVKNDNPRIFDDEYTERLSFEIDPDLQSFEFRGDSMLTANANFFPDCECLIEIVSIQQGVISGEKRSGKKWEVTVDVEFDWNGIPQQRSFTEVFELSSE